MILKRKNYSGYEEKLGEAGEYINAQVGNAGGLVADNLLDPADRLMEYYDKSPIQPRKVTRIRKGLKPLSYLLKRGRNKTKKEKK